MSGPPTPTHGSAMSREPGRNRGEHPGEAPDIIKAMPRRSTIWLFALYAAAGLAVFLFGEWVLVPGIRDYLSVQEKALALFRFKVVMVGIGVSLLPVVAGMFWLASRIIVSRQFPHPGAKVFRDTRIQRGRLALVRGWVIAFCGMLILVCAAYAAYLPFGLFEW